MVSKSTKNFSLTKKGVMMNRYIKKIEDAPPGVEIMSMQEITKIYSNGVKANDGVNFNLNKGEIHGLIGENGAGKTTLMKVLFGIEEAEFGDINLVGERVDINSPIDALNYGIGMVHQHFKLVESFTVAENMALGYEPTKYGIFFDQKEAYKDVVEVSAKYGLPVEPNALVRDLSVGYKQRVEILKMLLHGAKILLLDEPTALLTPQETEELFEQLISLRNQGYSIVFISHKLNEVSQICDRVTVLRDGKSISTMPMAETNESQLSKLMVGRDIDLEIEKTPADPKEVVLSVRNLNDYNQFGKKVLNNVNFDVHAGEILGVAAIEGNGQSELADLINGLRKIKEGQIYINNEPINQLDISEIRNLGTSIVHEDRINVSASTNQSVKSNLMSDRFTAPTFSKHGVLKNKELNDMSDKLINEFDIKTRSGDTIVRTLSGGNIQKVVVAREFSSQPKLLILSQPTRGIDVGAAELVHKKALNLRDSLNTAILLFSADLVELLQLSDSIIVLYEGEIVAYFESTENLNDTILGEYMLGINRQSDEEIAKVVDNV